MKKQCPNFERTQNDICPNFEQTQNDISCFEGLKNKHRVVQNDVEMEDEGFSDDDPVTGAPPFERTPDTKRHSKGESKHANSSRMVVTAGGLSQQMSSESFESGYGVHDAMLNGYTDLFHEVDSLMNITHEDHLNDTVFYLPMSCPGEVNPHAELENTIQVSEAFRNEFPSSVFCNQDVRSDSGILDSLPFSETEFLSDHSKDYSSSPDISSGSIPVDDSIMKPKSNSGMKRRKSVESGIDALKGIPAVDYFGFMENIVPAGRKTRTKSGKSDSQSDDSGIGEPHSVASSNGGNSLSLSESDGVVGPVDISSLDANSASSLEAKVAQTDMSGSGKRVKTEEEKAETLTDVNGFCVEGEDPQIEEEMNLLVTKNTSESCCSSHFILGAETADIDRFVICSDHTMECVLCSYTTDSYSAFKSHIICSHPCWRITKKLSKNRLLVERSIRNGVRIPSKKIGEKALPGDLDSTLTGGRKLNKKYIYRRQLFERNKRLFKCVLCLRLFVFEGSVVNHVTETHQEKVAYDFIHVSNDHGEHFGPIHRCPQKSCFYSADNEADLSKHHTECHTRLIYRCQVCGFTAETSDAVRAHGLKMHKQQLACFFSAGPIAVAAQSATTKSE